MPEYLALVHHRNATDDSAPPEPLDVDDVEAMFARADAAGLGTVQ